MSYIIEIIKFINNWQNTNDENFKTLPNDEHSYLVFNHKNQIFRFVFSNKYKRDKCRRDIPLNLLNNYDYFIEQEDGFTYYLFTKGDFDV